MHDCCIRVTALLECFEKFEWTRTTGQGEWRQSCYQCQRLMVDFWCAYSLDNNFYLLKTVIQAVKNGAAKSGSFTQDGQGEKARWRPRNGCDGWSMAKFLFMSLSQLH